MINNSHRTTGKNKIGVVLYASYRIVLESLEILFESTNEITLIAGVSNIEELARTVELKQPNVLVICLTESENDQISFISNIQNACPNIKVLVFTSSNDINEHLKAVRLGAFGVITKDQSGRTLIRAIRQIHNGDTWFNQALISRMLNGDTKQTAGFSERRGFEPIEVITRRELDVINLVSKGLKNKEIGKQLFISEATVRHHLSSIYGKVGVADRLNLVIYAYQKKIINFDQ